jgi:FkbM family methyltransferase
LVAIDPQPFNCDRILSNACLNGFANILVVVAAVGPKDGLVMLKNPTPQDKSKLSLSERWPHEDATAIHGRMLTLDTVTKRLPSVSLLKVDVEAYEWEVLQDATATLAKTENLIIELHPESGNVSRSANLLKETGFRLSDVRGKAWEPGQPCEGHFAWASRGLAT